jgi:hypothetical protein
MAAKEKTFRAFRTRRRAQIRDTIADLLQLMGDYTKFHGSSVTPTILVLKDGIDMSSQASQLIIGLEQQLARTVTQYIL